jgi:diacylglycerol kinase (ATP)
MLLARRALYPVRITDCLSKFFAEISMNDTEELVSEFKSQSGMKRVFYAFFYSVDGFKSAWKNEHAFRQELMLVTVGIIGAFFLDVTAFEKLMMIAVLLQILVVELINSAIEAVVDRVSLERHSLSKRAKDLGSAAVLLTLLMAFATWGVVLFNRYM